ncbi:hypothetical protein F1188_11505 [Roseospira marina]|uniref:DUF5648 domain-containing protein n=1 Tax=Roseospira marina TaxID=140057 RepID=A0A5M6IB34_9PROT|nr:hypothetical protein [Roseospira marina]KAA5605510.1 hypothetical protein F1188_11505 [Roseospira marina]MBB4314483.1 hypothetical protein [Roseospira marina]MBB5088689.1 hypothetical protein [Roseospira marina]
MSIPYSETTVYRFLNTETNTHFFTASYDEAISIYSTMGQYRYEGPAFDVADDDGTPFFRFFNTVTGTHFYTTDTDERDTVIATLPEYSYEGVAYRVGESGDDGDPLYRFFNTETGTHFYTANEHERDTVMATLPAYTYEGIAAYVPAAEQPSQTEDGVTLNGGTVLLPEPADTPHGPATFTNIDGVSGTVTVPAGSLSYSGETTITATHTGSLVFDATAAQGTDTTKLDLTWEAASAHSEVYFGGGSYAFVSMGPGTDIIHFSGQADMQVAAVYSGGIANAIGGEDIINGLTIGNEVGPMNFTTGFTITHTGAGDVVFDFGGGDTMTLIGVSSVSETGYGGYVVDGVM